MTLNQAEGELVDGDAEWQSVHTSAPATPPPTTHYTDSIESTHFTFALVCQRNRSVCGFDATR